MNLSQLVNSLANSLTKATDSRYERAIGAVAKPDGYGLLSDRLIPRLSTGGVNRRQLTEIVKNVSTLRPEFVGQNKDEIMDLIKRLEREDGTENEERYDD